MNDLSRIVDALMPKVKQKMVETRPFTNQLPKEYDVIYNRMIYLVAPRPENYPMSAMIAEMFNPETDMYVGSTLPAARMWAKEEFDGNCLYFSTGHTNANSLRGREAMRNIKRVFINVGPMAISDKNTMSKIRRCIHNIEGVMLHDEAVYIIT